MNQNDLGIKNKKLYRSLVKQVNQKYFGLGLITKKGAQNLKALFFENVEINSLEFLKFFPNVTDITFSKVKSEINLNGIQHLKNLQTFMVYDSFVKDFSPLMECTQLELFDYMFEDDKRSEMEDFSFLVNFPLLVEIDLTGNRVRDISFVEKLTNLQEIVLSNNPIATTQPLSYLPMLNYIEAENCGLTDLEGVDEVPVLRSLYIKNNSFDSDKVKELQNKFGNLEHFEMMEQ